MNSRLYLFVVFALLVTAGSAYATGDTSLNGPPIQDVSDVAVSEDSGLTAPGSYITLQLEKSGNDCQSAGCHPDWESTMLSNTPHTSTAEEPTTCNDCHYTAANAKDMGYTVCDGNVIPPKKLIFHRQSSTCAEAENCHPQQYEELKSGKMFDYVSCLICHDPYKMEFGVEDEETEEVENGIGHAEQDHEHTHGLVSSRTDTCLPCHSLKAGDSSELSVIHYGIMSMAPGLSSEEATEVSNRTPTCIDCHLLETVDEDGVDHENHKFTFELETDNQTCLIQGCHPDKDYDWVATQVHRWQDMKKTVDYDINEILFPTPPATLTEFPVKIVAIAAFLVVVALSALASLKYQRRDEE